MDVARKLRQQQQQNSSSSKSLTGRHIDLEWVEQTLQTLFKERQNKSLDSRIRFMIQDVMDSYEKEWKPEIVSMNLRNAEG